MCDASPTGRRLQLCAIDEHNLSGIWPVLHIGYQTSANRILPDVIPFLSVTFITAQNMIEKAALPGRQPACRHNMFRDSLFQPSYPWTELKIVGSADEEVNVIGHDHISTNSDVMLRMRARCERYERAVHRVRCKEFLPLLRAKRDEEQGIISENPLQAGRKFWIFVHANFVAASLWEAQCRCSLATGASPTGRRLQKQVCVETMRQRVEV